MSCAKKVVDPFDQRRARVAGGFVIALSPYYRWRLPKSELSNQSCIIDLMEVCK